MRGTNWYKNLVHKYKSGKILDYSVAANPKEPFNKIKSSKKHLMIQKQKIFFYSNSKNIIKGLIHKNVNM